ncbi:Hsp70 family protein [Actinocrispum wychmicini]|uniref:Hsp70 protein n=1 Tax=Actinocrispum wychmicini TaxID=1213861 RepID=A0A4R2JY57_9PSEU|nr:Hsp70 family protein [Actinocrispum wychmicini]TCO62169.1 Hsp70 protein [Actinocrispum wychmicini]
MSGTAIGVDVGSLGLRVAWSGPDCQPVELGESAAAEDQPWVTAEFEAGTINFVTARHLRSAAAVHKLVTELSAARTRVGTETGHQVDRVVLTVPARMESRDRIGLRALARRAGFTDVHLVNDAIAAALGEDGSVPARTVLVYSLGYSGFEVGLLRVARGQVRVLHHMAADAPSGAGMDSWIMNTWLRALGQREADDLTDWTAAEWTRLRAVAEEAKHQLAANQPVRRFWPPWSTGPSLVLETPTPEEFRQLTDAQVAATRDHVREVLADAKLSARDIDAVLLVGGCTALPAVPAMLDSELGVPTRRTGPNHLAWGAAVYGARLGPMDAEPDQAAEFIDVPEQPVALTGLTLPAHGVAPDTTRPSDPIADARRLWSDGKPDDAKALLTALIDRAGQLLKEIAESTSETESLLAESTQEARDRARRAIDRAVRRLTKGQLADAVSESHQAWELAPDLDDVFQKMIDVHLAAARAADTPDRFADAYRWLNCAQAHARFNQEVVDCLVERMFAHARHHHDRGQLTEAMGLLEQCLNLDPDHPGGQELSAEIGAHTHG